MSLLNTDKTICNLLITVWCLGKAYDISTMMHLKNSEIESETYRSWHILHWQKNPKLLLPVKTDLKRIWKIIYGFFTAEPVHSAIWTRSTPAIRQRIIYLFPYLTKWKILAGHRVYKILTHSTIHSYSLQKTVSAEASSHKSGREAITVLLKKGVKTQCSDAISVCNSNTYSLINSKCDCEIRTRTTRPGAWSSSQVTHTDLQHADCKQQLHFYIKTLAKPPH